MKKITYLGLILLIFLLASCWSNQQTKQQSENLKQSVQISQVHQGNQVSKQNQLSWSEREDKNTANENNKTTNENNKQNLYKEDKILLNKIDSTIKDVWWYKVDCKKIFKTESWQRNCEMKQLAEAGNGCIDSRLWITLGNLDKYFTKKRFDLLSEEKIQEYKERCRVQLLEHKKQQEEIKIKNKKLQKLNNEMSKIEKNFKLSDCSKYFTGQSLESVINSIPKNVSNREQIINNLKANYVDPVKVCKIQYAIQVKGDCKILPPDLQTECEQVKKDVEIYSRMQREYNLYARQSLFLKIREKLSKKYGLEEELPMPVEHNLWF